MKVCHLIELHEILSIMVDKSKISVTEKHAILAKAGLYYQGSNTWKDENNTIYTLE